MKVAVIAQDGVGDFIPPDQGPWIEFFSVIEKRGHEIVSYLDDPHVVIFMNSYTKLQKKIKRIKSKKVMYLVLWEPVVTHPENFNEKYQSHFQTIFSPSVEWISGRNVKIFNWPQCEPRIKELTREEWQGRIDKPSIFQANKYSFIKGEKYSQRRRFIERHEDEIYVYGQDWNRPLKSAISIIKAILISIRYFQFGFSTSQRPIWIKLRNYRGFTKDKDFELSKFKFTIVIENSSDYVSEKIFEAIRNGCVVFYEGPDLEKFGVPSEIVVKCSNIVDSYGEVYSYLLKNQEKCFEIAQSAVRFHNSASFSKLLNVNVLANLGNSVCDSLEESNCDD
jgi:hypothetical protein